MAQDFQGMTAEEVLTEDADRYRQTMAYYSCAIMEIETKFNVLNAQFNARDSYNPIDTVKSRLKSASSIAEKLVRRGLPVSLESAEENLTDIAGLRIICPFEEDIYTVVECLLKQDDVNLVERKDYIERPKGNGYRSLHLIVEIPVFLPEGKKLMKVEVQLRTIAMEVWANLEHRMRYKKGLPQDLAETLAQELNQCADVCAELDARMGQIHRKVDACQTFAESL